MFQQYFQNLSSKLIPRTFFSISHFSSPIWTLFWVPSIMGRSPCCDDQSGLKKGPWTTEEDHKLVDYITRHGHGSWRALPKLAGLNRCGKSCRLRWTNYLRPDIKRGKFEEEEERIIINLHSVLGNKWSKIATHLPGRTDNEIKNYWNTHLRKKLLQMGIDPNTHKPRTDLNHLLSLSQLLSAAANVGNMMSPWDNALKLQADAAQLAKMQLLQHLYMQVVNSSAPPNIDMNTGLVGSQNLNPFGGHVKGASTMPRGQEGNPEGVPGAANDFNSISNSLADFESGFDAEGLDSNNKNLSSFCDVQIKNPFPNLVSASRGTFTTTTQMEIMSGDPAAYLSTHSPTTMFEDWEKLIDDETSESYWKDIIESMS